jgi:S1-C subfamily serine protease
MALCLACGILGGLSVLWSFPGTPSRASGTFLEDHAVDSSSDSPAPRREGLIVENERQLTSARLMQYGGPPDGGFVGAVATPPNSPEEQPWLRPGLTECERSAVYVYHQANRSVVNINTEAVRTIHLLMLELTNEGAGSGCVLDQAGHIITNNHVIEDARKISVTLFNGQTYEARVVGTDRATDLAVIKIDAPPEELFPLPIGDSRALHVGMQVYAIGNPFGLERTLTSGIVSSLNRTLGISRHRTIRSIIQIDAAINPGSSGGPLLNTQGELIGINTAIASTTGQSSGVGFAIPSALVTRVIPELIRHGRFLRPDAGIVKVLETNDGLLILSLEPGGPAERAGLRGPVVERRRRGPFTYESENRKAADVIIAVNDTEAKTADDFLAIVESQRPGDAVTITVLRDGQPVNITVTLATAPAG